MKFKDILMTGQDENVRRAIKSTMENYQTPWKVIHESLQNSLDAIYKSGKEEGYISITVDLNKQSITIRDDGIGFPHSEEGRRLLGLHGSDKDDDPRLGGNLGYGIKAVICSTKKFELVSRRNGQRWGFEVTTGYDLDGAEFSEFPIVSEDHSEDGTEIYYEFPTNEVTDFINEMYSATPGIQTLNRYDDTVSYLSIKDNHSALLKTLIIWYFRTSTYAANIDRLINGGDSQVPKVTISFKIICDKLPSRDEVALAEDIYNVLHLNEGVIEVQFENKFWDVEEFFLTEKGKTRPGLPFTIVTNAELPIPEIQELKSEQVLIFKFNTLDDYRKLIRYPNGRIATSYRGDSYYERKVFNALQGAYVIIGRKRYLDHMLLPEMPNRQTAFARGVPTQDFIGLEPGLWESARSENTVLFAPNVADPLNLGKLQIAFRKRPGWLREFYTDMFIAHLKRVSAQVARREITEPDDMHFPEDEDPAKDFVDREKIFEAGSEDNYVIIKPKYENELIALFFELIGRGHIDGYQFYGLSGYSRYDGKSESKMPDRDYFRSAINQDSKLWTIEFKVRLSTLVNDFEKNSKRPTQLHLAIVWEIDAENILNQSDYKVVASNIYHEVSGVRFPSDKLLPEVETILAVRQEGRWLPIQVLEVKRIVERIGSQS